MIATKPIPITRAKLISTTAVDEPLWSATTTYGLGATARVVDTAWQSLAADNVGHPPETSPLWWDTAGPANALAMFDDSPATYTEGPMLNGAPQPLVVHIQPQARISALGLLNMVGSLVQLQIYASQAGPLIEQHQQVLATSLGTYHSWTFDPLQQVPDALFFDLGSSNAPHVVITLHPVGAMPARIGLCAMGRQTAVGVAEYGFARGSELRGKGYLDKNDNPVRLDRGHKKTSSGTLVVNNRPNASSGIPIEATYDRVQTFLDQNIGVPMLWALNKSLGDHKSAVLFGDYERTNMVINDYPTSRLSIDINGRF